MATLSLDDPRFQPLTPEEEEKRKKQKKITEDNKQDLVKAGTDETDIELPAEENSEVSGLTSFVSGIASGAIKIPEGVASITAELMDLGAGQLIGVPSTKDSTISAVAEVEKFFDTINPFEEFADQRAAGKISEALTQLIGFGTAGGKIALKTADAIAERVAKKAVSAKKAGKYVDPKNPNFKKGTKKAAQLNKLTGAKRFGVMAVGGGAGEIFVVDNEKIGTFGDLFEAGPTELDREQSTDIAEDASRRLLNRIKFGSESVLLSPFVYGVGKGAKALAKRGKELAYSSSRLERALDKLASVFRFRGTKPQEIAVAKQQQKARGMRDTNFAEEKVALIDREIDKVFPEYRKFFNASSNEERKQFLKLLDDTLFEGDLTKPLDATFKKDILTTVTKRMGKEEGAITGNKILDILDKTRKEFNNLLEITASGPGAKVDLPTGVTKDLRKIMGNRVKNYIGNTFEIFEDAEAGFFQKYKPTKDAVKNTAALFKRYAAKNNNPITDLEAEGWTQKKIHCQLLCIKIYLSLQTMLWV